MQTPRRRPMVVTAVAFWLLAALPGLSQSPRAPSSGKLKTAKIEAPPAPAAPVIEHVEEQKTAYLLSGIAKRQQGKYREAVDDLTIYITGNDRDPDGHWELAFAWALYNEARPMADARRKAVDHFRRCYELSPAYQRSLPRSAKPGVAGLVAEARKAAGVVGDMPGARPVDAVGLLSLAETQVDSGDLLESKKNFDEVQNFPPPPAVSDRERVRGKLDKTFKDRILKVQSLEVSNLPAAQSEAAELLRFFPDEPVALETYVRLQLKYSRAAMESVAGQKIYQSYRNNIEGFMLKGLYRDAISEVNRLLFNFPRTEFGEKKYNEILERNEAALKGADESLKGWRLEEARRRYEVIRDNYPFLGVAQDAISEIDDVRRKLEASLERDIEKGNFSQVYVTAKELSSKFPSNQKAKDAVKTSLDEVANRIQAGTAASREGRLFQAIVSFEKALSIVPGQSEAQEGLDKARAQIREDKKKLWAFMEMIPGGRFTLGGGPTPESKPKNKNASSDPFVLDRYKVSNAQYLQFVQATGSKAPDGWKDGLPDPQKSEFAVSGISHQDAVTYCRWIGKRLPDEFEWEKAARGPGALDFPYEDAESKDRKAYNPFQEYPVNRWPVLASPYKVEGMHTSIWEWTSSWFAPYPGNDESSVLNIPRDTFKVVRGGSRSSTFPGIEKPLEVTARDRRPPNRREADVGFRCASQTSEAPSWLNDEPQPEKLREPAAAVPAIKSGN